MALRLNTTAVAGLVLAAVTACTGRKDEYASGAIDTAKSAQPIDSPTMAPAVVVTAWTGPMIIAFSRTVSDDEVKLGKLAQEKATHPDVKAFGREMAHEHSELLADARKLAGKLSMAADTTAADVRDLAARGREAFTELKDKAAGTEWDKAYMDKMVEGHQNVLNKLQDAAKTADADLRAALEKSIAKVQAHLTKAQEVRAKLQ